MGVCFRQPTNTHLRMGKHLLAFLLIVASVADTRAKPQIPNKRRPDTRNGSTRYGQAITVQCDRGDCIGAIVDHGNSPDYSNTGFTGNVQRKSLKRNGGPIITGTVSGDIIVRSNSGTTRTNGRVTGLKSKKS